MNLKNIRCVYIIEGYTHEGEKVLCQYARNKKDAQRIARKSHADDILVRKLSDKELYWLGFKGGVKLC